VRPSKVWIAVRGDHEGALFRPLDRGADPRARLTGDGVWKIVRRLGREAGLQAPARPHGLRHASITRLLDLGRDVMQFSRHKNVKTVLIYDDRPRDVAGDLTRQLAAESA
jgi:integrase